MYAIAVRLQCALAAKVGVASNAITMSVVHVTMLNSTRLIRRSASCLASVRMVLVVSRGSQFLCTFALLQVASIDSHHRGMKKQGLFLHTFH